MHGMGSGPTSGASMNSFTAHTERHDYLAWKFQHAIDNDDAEKFDVLSLHTGGWMHPGRQLCARVGGARMPCHATEGTAVFFVRHVALPLLAVMFAFAFAATAEPTTGDTVGGVPTWPPEKSFVNDMGSIATSLTPWTFDTGELTSTAP
ncbi:hypothetical protein CYMTET_41145 [Cymbomonas tetramitiformis]|uniref:Uncharacterized protein n=1 Tax=Cymbomonas tetramitiformis TaxID=36881 RepID=A0AAE0C8F7_9CHLO|nr:hypothetical protein CYMTET_41145 [Cymbomonas tetramitiformis]